MSPVWAADVAAYGAARGGEGGHRYSTRQRARGQVAALPGRTRRRVWRWPMVSGAIVRVLFSSGAKRFWGPGVCVAVTAGIWAAVTAGQGSDHTLPKAIGRACRGGLLRVWTPPDRVAGRPGIRTGPARVGGGGFVCWWLIAIARAQSKLWPTSDATPSGRSRGGACRQHCSPSPAWGGWTPSPSG